MSSLSMPASSAYIVGVARSLIAPKGGLYRDCSIDRLAAPTLRHAWAFAKPIAKSIRRKEPDLLILGNALAAGGNPARLCGLSVFSDCMPALSVDTQCCSGLDAIALAAAQISAGVAEVVIAGGVESFSQAPIRQRKTKDGIETFHQARFAPLGRQDPDVLYAAQDFAREYAVTRQAQQAYAIESHRKALAASKDPARRDPYIRPLDSSFCDRLPALIGDTENHSNGPFALTAATVAPQADAAAVALLVSGRLARFFPWAIEVFGHRSIGCPPHRPAQGASHAASALLSGLSLRDRQKIKSVELMESFAAQAIVDLQTLAGLGLLTQMVNPSGGMLARGHPIAASGAVLVGNLFLSLQGKPKGTLGLAAIPSAGGLGSALLLRKP